MAEPVVIPPFQTLKVSLENNVLVIVFNRIKRKNAFDRVMYEETIKVLEWAGNSDAVTCALITGAGDYFSSGNDLANFINIPDGMGVPELSKLSGEILRSFTTAFLDFPKPLIAYVNGPAIGVAVTMLGLCDIVYASEKATFSTPFARLAQTPEACSSFVFPRVMGFARANEMLLMGRTLNAEQAARYGLLSDVLPSLGEALGRCKEMAQSNMKVLMYGKKLIRGPLMAQLKRTNNDEVERLVERWQSPELVEVLMSFVSRKTPSKL